VLLSLVEFQMTRIYTRTGDKGETSLGDGSRASKSSPRIILYGDVDELNSVVGHALAVLHRTGSGDSPILDALSAELAQIQCNLFDLGAILANPGQSKSLAALPVQEQPFNAASLEQSMDSMDKSLAPLHSFILPGGSEAAGILHVARCVSRRVERGAVSLSSQDDVPAGLIIYLNRLSDFLFTAARAANAALGVEDVPWMDNKAPHTRQGD
jgi:cob(I)alamin adenosyltransferase